MKTARNDLSFFILISFSQTWMDSSSRTEEDRGHSFKSSVFTFHRHNGGGGDYQMSQQRKIICGRFIQVGYSLVRYLVFIFPYFIC